MFRNEILNSFYRFIIDLCNGSLYSIDEEDKKYEKQFYSEYKSQKRASNYNKPKIFEIYDDKKIYLHI